MHKHLTWTDRLKIEKGLKEGLKPCAIADRLHVHNTTIYRELKRGRYTHLNSDLTTEERYSPEIAQQRYEENLKAKGGELKIGNDYELALQHRVFPNRLLDATHFDARLVAILDTLLHTP